MNSGSLTTVDRGDYLEAEASILSSGQVVAEQAAYPFSE